MGVWNGGSNGENEIGCDERPLYPHSGRSADARALMGDARGLDRVSRSGSGVEKS